MAPLRGLARDPETPAREAHVVRKAEVEHACGLVLEGGVIVWVGDIGSGKTSLLTHAMTVAVQRTIEDDARRTVHQLRVNAATGPYGAIHPGDYAKLFVEQLAESSATPVPGALRGMLEGWSAGSVTSPDLVATVLGQFLEVALAGDPLVMGVDDLDQIDELSRFIIVSMVAQRRAALTLLATARSAAELVQLPQPYELRELRPLTPAEALPLIAGERPGAVSPFVAGQLARALEGNVGAIAEVARVLTDQQLAGHSALPDPLPAVPSLLRCCEHLVDHLGDQHEEALRLAALSVRCRVDGLLAASGLTIEDLVDGPVAVCLRVSAGRVTFADARLRHLVLNRTSVLQAARTHAALAEVAASQGDRDAEVWHLSQASLDGDSSLVPELIEVAGKLLRRGDALWAFRLAQEAAGLAEGQQQARAAALTGQAAAASGLVWDALARLGYAHQAGDLSVQAEVVGSLIEVVSAVNPQVPGDLLDVHVERCRTLPEAELPPGYVTYIMIAIVTAANLHAARGEGTAAREMLALASELVGSDPRRGRVLQLGHVWLGLFGVTGFESQLVSPTASDSPRYTAFAGTINTLVHAREGQYAPALRLVASELARSLDVRPEQGWTTSDFDMRTPSEIAELQIVSALVQVWAGDVRGARASLQAAAFDGPTSVQLSGLCARLARRLDVLCTGAVGEVASAIASTSGQPPLLARVSASIDRAAEMVLKGQASEAGTLMLLAFERARPDDAWVFPIPMPDIVFTLVRAGRMADAARGEELVAEHRRYLPAPWREAQAARNALLLATPEDEDAALRHMIEVGRGLESPLEIGRNSLVGGWVLRDKDPAAARHYLLGAIEMLEQAGASAFADLARRDLAALGARDGGRAAGDDHGAEAVALSAPSAVSARGSAGSGLAGASVAGRGPVGPSEPSGHRDVPDVLRGRLGSGRDARTAPTPARPAVTTVPAWATALTERELEVALAVVAGASNRQIADSLALSVRTVEVHVSKIFKKLGVRSRRELGEIAFAEAHGAAPAGPPLF